MATVEYVVLLVTVFLGLCAVLLSWWRPTLQLYTAQVAWLALPFP